MTVNIPQPVDFSAFLNRDQQGNALAWSLGQFRDIPLLPGQKQSVYQQVLQAFTAEVNQLYVALCQLAQARTITGGSGVWLDGIGRIVGQDRDNVPTNIPDAWFYWDDDVGNRPPGLTDSTPHYMDASKQWVTGAIDGTTSTPTDNDYRNEIVRRIFQNINQNSSISEIQNDIQDTLGINVRIVQNGVRSIQILYPAGTPDYLTYFLTGKDFGIADGSGTYNHWWYPFPACITVTTGTY
jgi:hypothetical protein